MSRNIDIVNVKGEKVGEYILDDSCLEFDKGAQAVHDAVVGFLAVQAFGNLLYKAVGKAFASEMQNGQCLYGIGHRLP